jgi:hypothetical protein
VWGRGRGWWVVKEEEGSGRKVKPQVTAGAAAKKSTKKARSSAVRVPCRLMAGAFPVLWRRRRRMGLSELLLRWASSSCVWRKGSRERRSNRVTPQSQSFSHSTHSHYKNLCCLVRWLGGFFFPEKPRCILLVAAPFDDARATHHRGGGLLW